MVDAEKNKVFKEQSYWDERFQDETEKDWLLNFEQLKEILQPHITPKSRILLVGCGNSSLSQNLYDSGFENLVNLDYSSVVIEKMRLLHQTKRPNMKWIQMDMTDMTFPEESFDVVLDKAAMDALVVDEGDVWDPKNETIVAVDKMCRCVRRILKPTTGKFIQISFSQPHFRTKYLMGERVDGMESSPYSASQGFSQLYQWDLSFSAIGTSGCLDTFFYVMKT